MSYIRTLISEVNETHRTLGNLIAVCQIAIKARKMVLIVSPSGCGKSTAMLLLGKNISGAMMPDRISMAGLATVQDKLTSFRSVIIVDDIATTQTAYARSTTITTLCALVYTHRVESMMAGYEYQIEDFYGSALVGIQPVLLRDLMLSPEWDASIQDKVLRYYHLYRPLSPTLTLPDVTIHSGLDIDKVNDFEPNVTTKIWRDLQGLADCQWSKARTKEHIKDMLKGVASLEGRPDVEDEDYILLTELLKPMAIENVVVVKNQLEGERELDNNLLALLAEYYTYSGEFPLAQIAQDYKISISQCYRIMQQQNGYWQQISKSPTVYRPTKKLISILKSLDLEVENVERV